MIVDLATHLDAAPAVVWDHITRISTFRRVSFPLMVFHSREPGGFPKRWREGPHRVWMMAFGVLPFGPQTINIRIGPHDGETRRLQDAGVGWMARVWDHHITIAPEGAGARYRDRVRIEAGALTPFVWGFAALYFRWRQLRWRVLARRLTQKSDAGLRVAGRRRGDPETRG